MSKRGRIILTVVLCCWLAVVIALLALARDTVRLQTAPADSTGEYIYAGAGGYNVQLTEGWQVAYDQDSRLVLCETENNGIIEIQTEFGGYDYMSVQTLAKELQERLTAVYDTVEYGEIRAGGSSRYLSAYFAALVTKGAETMGAQYTILWISEGIRCYATFLFPPESGEEMLREGLTIINSITYPEPGILYEKYM